MDDSILYYILKGVFCKNLVTYYFGEIEDKHKTLYTSIKYI